MIEKYIFITASFINQYSIKITWTELLWGLNKGFISAVQISKYALEIVATKGTDGSDVDLLASVTKDELFQVRDLLEKLAYIEDWKDENATEDKWLYIILLWLYEHKGQIDDPLEKVEIVYADFNYPIKISSFVRYMPLNEISEPLEDGVSFLYRKWKEFLDHHPL